MINVNTCKWFIFSKPLDEEHKKSHFNLYKGVYDENVQRISCLTNNLTFKLILKHDSQMFLIAGIIIEVNIWHLNIFLFTNSSSEGFYVQICI